MVVVSLDCFPDLGCPAFQNWKLWAIVVRHLLGSRLLLENHIICSKRRPRLRVLGPNVAAGSKPTRIVQGSGLKARVWKVALVVEPLVVNAGAALGAKVTTCALAMTRANKMSRLDAHFNLAILKTNTPAKGTPRLPLANRAVAGPNLSGPSEDFVPNRATLARAFIAAPHLSSPPQ